MDSLLHMSTIHEEDIVYHGLDFDDKSLVAATIIGRG
jgi:hypothetical protein